MIMLSLFPLGSKIQEDMLLVTQVYHNKIQLDTVSGFQTPVDNNYQRYRVEVYLLLHLGNKIPQGKFHKNECD
jgi:hypothetical protein